MSPGITVIVVLFGAVFLGVGIVSWRKRVRLEQTCTARVPGLVVDYRESVNTEHDSDSRRTRRTYTYAPVYTYAVDGREYRYESNIYTNSKRIPVGTTVTVFYDEADPNQRYVQEDRASRWSGPLFMGFGVLVFIVLVVVLVMEQ